MRRASVRGGAVCAALRLFRLLRSAGGVSPGVHGAGRVLAELSAEHPQADRRKAGRVVGRLGGARIHRGLARRARRTRSGSRRQAVRRRGEDAATGRQHLRDRRAAFVSGGELHCLRVAAHAQARASGVRFRRHVSRADSQREEGRRGDRDQLRAVRQGNAVLPARRASSQAKTLVITDSQLSPLARYATTQLYVKEGSAFAFRSLTSTICLCQALFIALAYKLELNVEESKDTGGYDD